MVGCGSVGTHGNDGWKCDVATLFAYLFFDEEGDVLFGFESVFFEFEEGLFESVSGDVTGFFEVE